MFVTKCQQMSSSTNRSLKTVVVNYMKEVGKWDDSLHSDIPLHWENYGGFILFSSPSFTNCLWGNVDSELWKRICDFLNGHSIALKGRIKNDSFRSPQARVVYGSSIVNYLDNKIKYSWDVEKVMFSAGNVTERHRIATLNCADEVIVDLFAGIGYFTLPYLVHGRAKYVHACEWNPDAVKFLRLNLVNNKVDDRCLVHEGDNRKVCPKKVANRVNLGLIPSCEDWWQIGCEALLPSGGLLYIHHNIVSRPTSPSRCEHCLDIEKLIDFAPSNNQEMPTILLSIYDGSYRTELGSSVLRWKHIEWFLFSLHISHCILRLLEQINCSEWTVMVDEIHRVKSYAPHIDHLVYSVLCRPKE